MGTKRFFASRWGMIAAGAAIGLMAALLQLPSVGNPPNMGLCMVCFPRDIAGAIGLHRLPVVQYLRPEIVGAVLGSMVAALVAREVLPRAGAVASRRVVR